MKHSDLIKDVIEKVRLPISVSEVKKRIDNLISRDYLERDEQDMQMYRYVAWSIHIIISITVLIL